MEKEKESKQDKAIILWPLENYNYVHYNTLNNKTKQKTGWQTQAESKINIYTASSNKTQTQKRKVTKYWKLIKKSIDKPLSATIRCKYSEHHRGTTAVFSLKIIDRQMLSALELPIHYS